MATNLPPHLDPEKLKKKLADIKKFYDKLNKAVEDFNKVMNGKGKK